MVGARRAHRVGGDHVPFGVRGVAKAREAAVERRRRGGGRRSKERGRKGRPCQRQPCLSCRTGSPWNSMKGDGPVLRDRSLPQGGERTDLVDRLPDERDALRDLHSGRRRRPGSRGISGTRDGEEDHGDGNNPPEEGAHHAAFMENFRSFCPPSLSGRSLPGVLGDRHRCHSPPGESCGNGSPCPPWREADSSSPGPVFRGSSLSNEEPLSSP